MDLLGEFFKDLTGNDLPEQTEEIIIPHVFVDQSRAAYRMVAEHPMRSLIRICEDVTPVDFQQQPRKLSPKIRFRQDPKFHNVVYAVYVPQQAREWFRHDMDFSRHLLGQEGLERLTNCQFVVRNISDGESKGEYHDAGALYWKPPKDYIEISLTTDDFIYYILHECGHRFEAKAPLHNGQHFSHVVREMYRWALENDQEFFITDYAKTNPHEFWAECFRGIFDGKAHYQGIFEFVRRAIRQYGPGLHL
jgi:hypothetical protein